MHAHYLNAIKSFEGFASRASWDYGQHSNGYGTRALHPGEQITREEAERRFAAEIAQARRFVDARAAKWDEGTKAALTSLTFNAGTKWASSGLGEAVRNFDAGAVRSHFLAYTRAGGTELPGLVHRRLAEAEWIAQADPATPAGPPPRSATDDCQAADRPGASTRIVRGAPAIDQTAEPTPAPGFVCADKLSTTALLLMTLDARAAELTAVVQSIGPSRIRSRLRAEPTID